MGQMKPTKPKATCIPSMANVKNGFILQEENPLPSH